MTLDKLIKKYGLWSKEVVASKEKYVINEQAPTPYHRLLEHILYFTPEQPFPGVFKHSYDLLVKEGLEPSQDDIEAFAKSFLVYEGYDRFWRRAGKFLSAMIALWENNTHTKTFIRLDFSAASKPVDYACIKLNNCSIQIDGSVGSYCGMNSKECNILIQSNAGQSLGYKAEKTLFKVSGETGTGLGAYAHACSYFVRGTIAQISPYILSSCEVYNSGGSAHTKVFP